MCGIAGRLFNHPGPIGTDMVQMLVAMRHRGYDSTGFSLYGSPRESGYVVRAHLDEAVTLDRALSALESRLKDADTSLVADPTWIETPKVGDAHIRLEISEPGRGIPNLLRAVETIDGFEVQSVGRALEIVKDIGDAREVAERHGLYDFSGSHGLGTTAWPPSPRSRLHLAIHSGPVRFPMSLSCTTASSPTISPGAGV